MRSIFPYLLITLCLMPAGCESFEPYDYEKDKDARFRLKESGCSLGIHGRKLYLKKELGKLEENDSEVDKQTGRGN